MSENFAALLEEVFSNELLKEGQVIKGKVVGLSNDKVIIDVGLKSEGRVDTNEFVSSDDKAELPKIGDEVEVYLERLENRYGELSLSRKKAIEEEAWIDLEKLFAAGEKVQGMITGRVKGGFTVNLEKTTAFLPGSQVDIRPLRDITHLLREPQTFEILKMDKDKGNIVVSRRKVIEETVDTDKESIIGSIKEGNVIQGVVKNITDYGAFVDLGGVDGLLHVTDISWKRVNSPREVLNIGDTIDVKVIKFNEESKRISLGMKQLETNPWEEALKKYKVGDKIVGKVTNITDYGAFVEIEKGLEGLVHVSEMSWTKKNVHPGKIISTSQEVEVQIIEIDEEKKRISLGIRQCQENPWIKVAEEHAVGDVITGEIRNITEFGMFVGISDDIDGMVHMSDISWDEQGEEVISNYKKGDSVEVKILDINIEKERISLGIKQLSKPTEIPTGGMTRGDNVDLIVDSVENGSLQVSLSSDNSIKGFIPKNDLSRDKDTVTANDFEIGSTVKAKFSGYSKKDGLFRFSIRELEIEEEKEVINKLDAESDVSGASLGDILGKVLNNDN